MRRSVRIGKSMEEKIHKRIINCSKAVENDLYKCHALVLKYIENRGHSTEIETVKANCKTLMEEAVEINEKIRQLARKAEGPKNTNPNKIFSSTNEHRLKKITGG